MSVYIKPLRGREEPVGKAFISYAREDATSVRNVIAHPFKQNHIPYFLDEKDIAGGSKTLAKLDEAMDQASCGVVVLSPHSIKSPWVWFETGVLVGRGKKLIPFILDASNAEVFLSQVPDFIKQFQCVTDLQRLLADVRAAVFDIGVLFDNDDVNARVLPQLKRVELTLELRMSPELEKQVKFGFLLIRFGRHAPSESDIELAVERQRILKPLTAHKVRASETDETIRIEYLIPIHEKLGALFKCFVDVSVETSMPTVIKALEEAGMLDVRQSDSAEKQRVYFLLPLPERSIVRDGDIVDNYIFPV